MAASGNSVAIKSFTSFTVSDGLLAKVVEAVKAGEKDARTSGDVKSFEVFYHGFRQNISVGKIFIVPAKVCDVRNKFPIALLYGTVVRTFNLGEETADLITNKIGDTEFDEYSQADYDTIKEKIFTGEDGKPTSLVLFAPHWSNIREYHGFHFVSDDEKLSNLVRHLIFSSYFNPAVSSAFNALMTTVDTSKLDVTDVTPKLTYPFLSENPLRAYPELVKQGGWRKEKIFLTAKTADAIEQDILDPQELNVFEALDTALMEATLPETESMEDVAEFDLGGTPNDGNAEIPEIDAIKDSIQTTKESAFHDDMPLVRGVVSKEQADWDAGKGCPAHANKRSGSCHECAMLQPEPEDYKTAAKNCTICHKPIILSPSAKERAAKDVTGKSPQHYTDIFTTHPKCLIDKRNKDTSDLIKNKGAGDGTELRHRPDYGEKGSFTEEINEENMKMGAKGHMDKKGKPCSGKFVDQRGCPTCGKTLKELDKPSDAKKGSKKDTIKIECKCGNKTGFKTKEGKTQCFGCTNYEPKTGKADWEDYKKGSAPFETPFTNVGPGAAAHDKAEKAIAVKVDTISTKGEAPIGIELDSTGVPVREGKTAGKKTWQIRSDGKGGVTWSVLESKFIGKDKVRGTGTASSKDEAKAKINEILGVGESSRKIEPLTHMSSIVSAALDKEIGDDTDAMSTASKAARLKNEDKLNRYASRKKADVELTEESIWADITEDFGPAPVVSIPGDGSSESGESTGGSFEESKAPNFESKAPAEEPKSEKPQPEAPKDEPEHVEEKPEPQAEESTDSEEKPEPFKSKESKKAALLKKLAEKKAELASLKAVAKKAGICWDGYERKPGTKAYEPGSCVKKADDVSSDISEAKSEVENPDVIDTDINQPTVSVEEAAKVAKNKKADVGSDISEAKSEVENPDVIDTDINQPTVSVEEAAKVAMKVHKFVPSKDKKKTDCDECGCSQGGWMHPREDREVSKKKAVDNQDASTRHALNRIPHVDSESDDACPECGNAAVHWQEDLKDYVCDHCGWCAEDEMLNRSVYDDVAISNNPADGGSEFHEFDEDHVAAAGDEHDEAVEMTMGFGDLAELAANLPHQDGHEE